MDTADGRLHPYVFSPESSLQFLSLWGLQVAFLLEISMTHVASLFHGVVCTLRIGTEVPSNVFDKSLSSQDSVAFLTLLPQFPTPGWLTAVGPVFVTVIGTERCQ